MNNFMISAKRFFTNKNTVTILGVLVILIILYVGYTSVINNEIKPREVVVATEKINPQNPITDSNVKIETVPGALVDNAYTRKSEVVGKYTGVGYTLLEGSIIYKGMLAEFEDLPGSWLKLLKTDVNGNTEVPYAFGVNMVTTFANSIQPGMHIDIYMKAVDESDLVMFGKLMENIEVLAVKDNAGKDVFTSQGEENIPSHLYFGIMDELHILLRKATYLTRLGVELIIVPHGGAVPANPDELLTEVSSEYLRDFIDANTLKIPDNNEYLDMEDVFDLE